MRFTAPYSIGIEWIAPLLGDFHSRHPEVRIQMMLTNEPLDLIDKEIDVALRIGNLPDSNLVARRLATFRTQVYASPSYIARHGEPSHPAELQHHRALALEKYGRNGNGNSYVWTLGDGTSTAEYRIDPVLVANDPTALAGALLCGEGLMLAADVMLKPYAERGAVRRVLAGWAGPSAPFNAVYPRGLVNSPKVRAFIDVLVERMTFDAGFMEELCPHRANRQGRDHSGALRNLGVEVAEPVLTEEAAA